MRMTYGPADNGGKFSKKLKRYVHTACDTIQDFSENCVDNLSQKSFNVNIVLGIVLTVLSIGFVSGFIMLHNIKNEASTTSQTRNDAQTTIIAKAESQDSPKVISIQDIKNITANYNVDSNDIKEGDYIDTSKISLNVTYSNNATKTVHADEFSITNADKPLQTGQNTFTIQYENTKCALTILVDNNKDMSLSAKTQQYKSEYDDADITYNSDRLWIAGTKFSADDTYWVFHIVCTPDNTPRCAMSDKEYSKVSSILANQYLNNWAFASNGSYFNDHYVPTGGVYINDGHIYDGDTTSGHELCITSDGLLFTPDAGLPVSSLIDMNVIDTIVSDNPVLIKDGELTKLSQDSSTSAKSIIAMKDKCDYYVIIAVDGMYTNYNSYKDLAQALYDRGCVYAKAVSSASNVTAALEDKVIVNPPVSNKPIVDVFAFYD